MASKPSIPSSPLAGIGATWWLLLMGAWLGVALVKLGNPVILDDKVQAPSGVLEWMFQPWPLRWGWTILGVVVALGVVFRQLRLKNCRSFWFWAPALWLLWQCAAASTTVDQTLTQVTLAHFAVCTLLFYLGVSGHRLENSAKASFLWGLLLGFLFVLWIGLDQHFGGLEATRKLIKEQPGWENLPKEYLKRINSDRIFATLVYPNALAGAILLLLPVMLWAVLRRLYRYSFVFRSVAVGMLAYLGAACLVWSGSKAGWLLAFVLIAVWLWHLDWLSRYRGIIVAIVGILGVCLFFVKYSSYFQRGATSVGARMDYWNAGMRTFFQRPVFGSGPGTFSVMYRAAKSPESEMALLAHNDFLQQGSDSGVIGFLLYLFVFPAGVIRLYRQSRRDHQTFALWLGLLGWTLQGFVEFGLYIPALSSTAFFFLGWLQGMEPSTESGQTRFDTEMTKRSKS